MNLDLDASISDAILSPLSDNSDFVCNSHGAEGGLAFCQLTLQGSIGRFSYGAAALWAPDAGMHDIHYF